MKPSAVRSYIPLIDEVAGDFVASLKDTRTIDDCLQLLNAVATECKFTLYNILMHDYISSIRIYQFKTHSVFCFVFVLQAWECCVSIAG